MKRVRDILLAVVAVMIVVACGESRHISDTHKQAEAVMQEHPDSALTLLQAINPDDLTTDRGRAMHALLLSQAYDKNYIDLTDDSLITIAVDYFAPTNEHYYAMLAHYYHAVVNFNANEFATSSISCLEAEKHALDLNNHQYLGMIYSLMMYIHNYSYNFDEELICAQKSLEHFKKHGDEKYTGNAMLGLARSFNNSSLPDSSLAQYEQISEYAKVKQDTMLLCRSLAGYAHTLRLKYRFSDAKNVLVSLLDNFNQTLRGVDYGHLGLIYTKENKLDSALYYIFLGEQKMLTPEDSIAINYAKYSYYKAKKDYDNVFKYSEIILSHSNHTTQVVWDRSVVKTQRFHYKNTSEKFEYKASRRLVYFIIAIVGLIFAVLLFGVYYYYIRHKRLADKVKMKYLQDLIETIRTNSKDQLEKNKKSLLVLKNQLKDTSTENEFLRLELKRRMQELELANTQINCNLQQKRFAHDAIKKTNIYSVIYSKLSDKIAVISKEEWQEISITIDSYYPQFRSTLLSLCKISHTEMKVCMLLKISFTSTEIAHLLNMSRSNPSTIKSRLFAKIDKENLKVKDLDELLKAL